MQTVGAWWGVRSLHIDHKAARTSLPALGSYTPEETTLSLTKQTFNDKLPALPSSPPLQTHWHAHAHTSTSQLSLVLH